MGRAVKPTKSAFDRRRAGHGDNVAFTAQVGVGGLGGGKRVVSITPPTLNQHQFTNRVHRKTAGNGKGKKAI